MASKEERLRKKQLQREIEELGRKTKPKKKKKGGLIAVIASVTVIGLAVGIGAVTNWFGLVKREPTTYNMVVSANGDKVYQYYNPETGQYTVSADPDSALGNVVLVDPENADALPDSYVSWNQFFPSDSVNVGDVTLGADGTIDYSGVTSDYATVVVPSDLVTGNDGDYSLNFQLRPANLAIADGTEVIGDRLFQSYTELESIFIPAGVKSIGEAVFSGCTKLTNITFDGTKEEWNAIEKGKNWDQNTGAYTVHCTDGDITK